METVELPTRPPDYIAPYGSAYWWREMIYKGATGTVARIQIDEFDEQMYLLDHNGKKTKMLAPNIKDLYNYWLFGAMEEAMLNVGNDDTTTKS